MVAIETMILDKEKMAENNVCADLDQSIEDQLLTPKFWDYFFVVI